MKPVSLKKITYVSQTENMSSYKLCQKLGEGAFGEVHQCITPIIFRGRKVSFQKRHSITAIKIIKHCSTYPSAIEEARILNSLNHNNIVKYLGENNVQVNYG